MDVAPHVVLDLCVAHGFETNPDRRPYRGQLGKGAFP